MAPRTRKTGLVDARGRPIVKVTGDKAKGLSDEKGVLKGYLEPVDDPSKLPIPLTWHVLVQPLQIPREVNGVVIPEEVARKAEYLANIVKVWRIGPLAFKDPSKYGENPVAPFKTGDWIMIDQYGGQKTMPMRREFRIVTEDECRAIIPDPSVYGFYFF